LHLALALQALGQENLEQGLIRNIAPVGEYFEILDHGDRKPQRDRPQRRFELHEFPALSRLPIHVLRRIRCGPEIPFGVFVLEFR